MPINQFFKKVEAIYGFNQKAEISRIIRENNEVLLFMLKSQLEKGKDADGKPAKGKYGAFYADRTVFNKTHFGSGLGKRTDVVTHYMTGRFYASLHVINSGSSSFSFASEVPYFAEILIRNSPRLMHLSRENMRIFISEIIMPALQLRFEQYVSSVR